MKTTMAIIFALLLFAGSSYAAGSAPDTTGLARHAGIISALVNVQTAAEDIIDFSLAKDWPQVQGDVAGLDAGWKKYDSLKTAEPLYAVLQLALSNSMAQLQQASRDKDATSTMQAANNLSAAVSSLLDQQHTIVPPDVILMQILEGQLMADGAAENYDGARRSLDKLKMVWNRVRGGVQDRNGHELADKYSASLRAQEIAVSVQDGPATSDEARKGRALLQSISGLYQ